MVHQQLEQDDGEPPWCIEDAAVGVVGIEWLLAPEAGSQRLWSKTSLAQVLSTWECYY